MDECGDLLHGVQSQEGWEDTRGGRNVFDPKTESSHLDPPAQPEPRDRRDSRSMEELSLPEFGIGFIVLIMDEPPSPSPKPTDSILPPGKEFMLTPLEDFGFLTGERGTYGLSLVSMENGVHLGEEAEGVHLL